MLSSGDPLKVATAVAAIAANAKVLGTLSVARALYECREGAAARLSNEIFVQVGCGLCAVCAFHHVEL